MRILILLLAFCAVRAYGVITGPLTSTFQQVQNPTGISTTAISSVGASMLFLTFAMSGGGDPSTNFTFVDQIGGVTTNNIWHWIGVLQNTTTATTYSAYAYNSGSGPLAVGASHTIVTSSPTAALSAAFSTWAGTLTSADPLDQQVGAQNAAASSLSTGSITPGQDGELIISGGGFRTSTNYTTTPLAIIRKADWVSGILIGIGQSFAIQGTAAAVSNTWGMAGGGNMAVSIASFRAAPSTAVVRHRVTQQ
jgi:hypothetical protein